LLFYSLEHNNLTLSGYDLVQNKIKMVYYKEQ